jgi:hypothetical protein
MAVLNVKKGSHEQDKTFESISAWQKYLPNGACDCYHPVYCFADNTSLYHLSHEKEVHQAKDNKSCNRLCNLNSDAKLTA